MRLKKIDCGDVTVEDVLANVSRDMSDFVLLDSSNFDAENNASYICIQPKHTYEMRENDVYVDNVCVGQGKDTLYQAMRQLLKQYEGVDEKHHEGFIGGFVGYVSYEATPLFLNIPIQRESESPSIVFRFYTQVLKIQDNKGMLFVLEEEVFKTWDHLMKKQMDSNNHECIFSDQMQDEKQYENSLLEDAFMAGVTQTKVEIERGNVYQLNLTRRLRKQLNGKTDTFLLEYYKQIRTRNKAPYGVLWLGEDIQFASSSPEQFFQLKRNMVTTKPIKGTRPRKNNVKKDLQMKKELAESTKDHAELLMITDLLRNDLNRVVENGTVTVTQFAEVCENPTVFHLVSTIQAHLPEKKDALHILDGLFPGGSITGAPKKAAVNFINQFETCSRGLYTGSCGYISVNKEADFNILIRTLFQKHDTIEVHVGGGIVYESIPHLEYLETRQKAKALLTVIQEVEQ